MPGVQFYSEDHVDLDFWNIPYAFDTTGGYLLPEYAPQNAFLVSKSRAEGGEVHDLIDETGCIVGGRFDTSADVLTRFDGFVPWLETRIGEAKERYHRKRRKGMH